MKKEKVEDYRDVKMIVIPLVKKEILHMEERGKKFNPKNEDDLTFVIEQSYKGWEYANCVTKNEKIVFLKWLKKSLYAWVTRPHGHESYDKKIKFWGQAALSIQRDLRDITKESNKKRK